jgi:hypothetical protein
MTNAGAKPQPITQLAAFSDTIGAVGTDILLLPQKFKP